MPTVVAAGAHRGGGSVRKAWSWATPRLAPHVDPRITDAEHAPSEPAGGLAPHTGMIIAAVGSSSSCSLGSGSPRHNPGVQVCYRSNDRRRYRARTRGSTSHHRHALGSFRRRVEVRSAQYLLIGARPAGLARCSRRSVKPSWCRHRHPVAVSVSVSFTTVASQSTGGHRQIRDRTEHLRKFGRTDIR